MQELVKRKPPYLSFRTFSNFLDALRVSGVPTRLDRSVMASKSGSIQALLLSALHFFGLVSQNGLPTADLEKLVQSEGRDRQETWRRILIKSYPALFKLDLQRATTQQVSEVLGREGLSSPDTIRKALNFFLIAAKDAGLKLSPHIKPYAGHKSARRTRPSDGLSETDPANTQASTIVEQHVNGSSRWQLALSKFPNLDPSWPDELRSNWVKSLREFCEQTDDENTP
jgi:hypothetical protein